MTAVSFVNGRFYASGGRLQSGSIVQMINTSTNGADWSAAVITQPITALSAGEVFYGKGLYLSAFNAPFLLISRDGFNFERFTPDNFGNGRVAYGNGVFASAGAVVSGTSPTGRFLLQASDNGTNWTTTPSGPILLFTDIAYGNGMYVSVGGGIASRPPGNVGNSPIVAASPTTLSFSEQPIPASGALCRIHFAAGLFHAVGYGGTILRSTNGTLWLKRTSGVSGSLRSITYGNGLWTAVGDNGALITSPSGQAWTLRSSGTSLALNGVTYGNGLFVAVGYLGAVITSPDGINWTVQFTDTLETFFDVAYYSGQFVAVGTGGTIFTSADSVNWQPRSSGTTNELHAVTAGGGHFVATGVTSAYGFNVLLSSTNGLDWVPRNPSTTLALYGARYINDTFFLLGANGTILQSLPLNPMWLTGAWNSAQDQFEVTIMCTAGQNFRLQSCDSFAGGLWVDRAVFSDSPSQVTFIDTTLTGPSGRFYRAIREE